MKALAERPRSCLQETEDLPRDFNSLFDDGKFRFDTRHIPESVSLYEQLDVKHDALSLIPPQVRQCPFRSDRIFDFRV